MDWELSSRHLLCGVAPIIALLAVYFIFLHFKERRRTFGHIAISCVFCFYLTGILTMTGIWYTSAFDPRIVYIPFVDMIRGPVDTILNVVLFIPLGIFLPLLYKKFDKMGKIALAGFLISASVEVVQMFGCGATDINDLITNTVGACLGFCIYKMLWRIIPESYLEKIQVDGSQCIYELVIFWLCTLLMMITIQPQIYHALFTAGGEIQTWN